MTRRKTAVRVPVAHAVAYVRAVAQMVKPPGMSTEEMDRKVAESFAAVTARTKGD